MSKRQRVDDEDDHNPPAQRQMRSVLDHDHFSTSTPPGRTEADPTLRFIFLDKEKGCLDLEKIPREIRDQIYRYVFRSACASTAPKRQSLDVEPSAGCIDRPKPLSARQSKIVFESDLVLDSTKALWLHRFPQVRGKLNLVEELEAFVFAECTVKIECCKNLTVRDIAILEKARRIGIDCISALADFVQNAVPILSKREDLKYLRISFTSYPGTLNIQGREAARMIQRKLDVLTAIKAEQVALDINLPVTWKHKVLPRLASIMMGDVAARNKDPTEDVPELPSRTASQYEPRKSPARAGLADIRSKYRTKGRPSGGRSGGF